MRTSVAIPGPKLGAPPRRVSALYAVHVVLGDFFCWFGAVFCIPAAFVPIAARDAGLVALVVAIFPAVGGTLFVLGVKKGLRGLRLLRTGVEGTGQLAGSTPTG